MNLQDRANQAIAQGALTNSKRPSTFVEGVYPTHLRRGDGCHVWDYENKRYYDFITGLGSNLLGYAQQDVNKAIFERMSLGASLSLGTEEEIKLAEKMKSIFYFCDRFKFLKTGTEACNAAIRIARAATNRNIILNEGYHGWSDIFVSLTKPALGVKDSFVISDLPANLEHISSETAEITAAIIVEPIICDWSPTRRNRLKDLREFCTKYGILLIFDEVITGFRFPYYCVSNYWDIQPDLIILGKAMGNGMPIAAVGGKKEIMECGEYFVSSTFAGETLSIASSLATINLLQTKYKLDELWRLGQEWLDNFNSIWPESIRIEGYPTRGRFVGDEIIKALFFQESIKAGMLFGPSWFFNFPLGEKSKITLNLCKDILCKIKSGSVPLQGKMPQSPFAEKMRKK